MRGRVIGLTQKLEPNGKGQLASVCQLTLAVDPIELAALDANNAAPQLGDKVRVLPDSDL